jgi:hypothetical protein
MIVSDLIKRLKSLPPNAEVRVTESANDETRTENFWLVDIDYQHRNKEFDFVDEVILIGME